MTAEEGASCKNLSRSVHGPCRPDWLGPRRAVGSRFESVAKTMNLFCIPPIVAKMPSLALPGRVTFRLKR